MMHKLLVWGVLNMGFMIVAGLLAAIWYINRECIWEALCCIVISLLSGWLGSMMVATIKVCNV